jgi:uncharacterized protein (DUF1697 family)
VTIYVALLRAVNVAGHKQVAMADLRGLLTQLSFDGAQSLLQSGNLVFRGKTRPGGQVERLLETGAGERLALQTDFFVRTAQEWKAVVAHNPFRREAEHDPGHLVVMFLKTTPDVTGVTALLDDLTGPEVVQADGRHLYITYPNGIGRSRLTNAFIEKRLSTRGTGRNWNTVLKLAALVAV